MSERSERAEQAKRHGHGRATRRVAQGWPQGVGADAAARTALAWQRSGLALAATGAVVARGVPGSGVGNRPVLGALVAVLGLSVWLVTSVTERRRAAAAHRPTATMADLVPLAVATVAVGVILLLLVAWPASA